MVEQQGGTQLVRIEGGQVGLPRIRPPFCFPVHRRQPSWTFSQKHKKRKPYVHHGQKKSPVEQLDDSRYSFLAADQCFLFFVYVNPFLAKLMPEQTESYVNRPGQLSSMLGRGKGTVAPSVNQPVGVLSCSTLPCPACTPCAAPPVVCPGMPQLRTRVGQYIGRI